MNKETLQGYNTRLNNNNINLDTILETINNLPEAGSGGGSSQLATYVVDNVNFLDYKGNTLYSHTLDEIQELTELPPLPTGDMFPGLKWNWTLEELKESGVPADVGALYDVDDDIAFILTVYVSEFCINKTSYLNISRQISTEEFTYTVDWGDGSELSSYTQAANVSTSTRSEAHIYTEPGTYTITLRLQNAIEQKAVIFNKNATNYHYCGLFTNKLTSASSSTYSEGRPWYINILHFVIGPKCSFPTLNVFADVNNLSSVLVGDNIIPSMGYAFQGAFTLKHFTFPVGLYKLGSSSNMFENSNNLKTISYPKATATDTLLMYQFRYCRRLKKLIIPEGSLSVPSNFVYSCSDLEYVWIPDTVTSLGDRAFYECRNLKKLRLSPNITSIGESCMYQCYNLRELELPTGLTSIGNNAFIPCGISTFDFSKSTTIPTVGTSTFSTTDTNLKIIVPDELYDTWITTSNWSTFVNYIVKASEA